MNDTKRKHWLLRGSWAIISLIGVSGVIAVMTYRNDINEKRQNEYDIGQEKAWQIQVEKQEELTTRISGGIFNRQTNEALGNIQVGFRNGNYSWLYTTAPDGRFNFELPYTFDQNSFPLRFVLTSSNWRGIVHQTNIYIRNKGEKKENVNIYINSQLLESWH